MKYFLVIVCAIAFTACGHIREIRIPDSVTAVKIRRFGNTLLIEHKQYGGFYSLPISGLRAGPAPDSKNTAPYKDFLKTAPQADEGSEIEVKWRWVKAKDEAGRLVLRDYTGEQVTEGPLVYLLNVDDYGGGILGYAVVTPGEWPFVFYIKPRIERFRDSEHRYFSM